MNIIIRAFEPKDIHEMAVIWNQVIEDGEAFPQENTLSDAEAADFFAEQTYSAVAVDIDTETVVGLYILHPNNIGRCGHLSNASYAVKKGIRGQHVGEKLVYDCLKKAGEFGFRILQFNAVVKCNYSAIHLYEKLGFVRLGEVPNGFRMKDGHYENIILFYHTV
nr:GNAT family N-acetyltransferase [uncultured Mediterraneibacter sp.]